MPTSFAIPAALRRKAGVRAQEDGLALASAVHVLLSGYAEGRIRIVAAPADDAVTVEKVEEIPMDAPTRRAAAKLFSRLAHAA